MTYRPLSLRLWVAIIPKDIINVLLGYVKTKWLSQKFDWTCVGNGGRGEGAGLQSFFTLKRALVLLIYNGRTPFEVPTTTPSIRSDLVKKKTRAKSSYGTCDEARRN